MFLLIVSKYTHSQTMGMGQMTIHLRKYNSFIALETNFSFIASLETIFQSNGFVMAAFKRNQTLWSSR